MTAAAIAVRETGILFTGEMVRATLDGRKRQTRRVVKVLPRNGGGPIHPSYNRAEVGSFSPRPEEYAPSVFGVRFTNPHGAELLVDCPYGQPGDRLWGRETHTLVSDCFGITPGVNYEADNLTRWNVEMRDGLTVYNSSERQAWKRRPSIFMFRAHSRLVLEITGIRVERVQEISEGDARAEGIDDYSALKFGSRSSAYRSLWNSLNEKRGFGWDVNPWAWVLEFKGVEP